MIDLLTKLVQTDSTLEKGEVEVAQILCDFFRQHGIECTLDTWDHNRANVNVRIGSLGSKPGLLFACHMDVVPPGSARWAMDPFSGQVKDGRLYGRGATDMKAGLAAAACAVVNTLADKPELKGDLVFTASAGEEVDCCGAIRYVKHNRSTMPPLAGVVIPEPTMLELVNCHRGRLWLELKTFGKTAHGSMPHLGVNAVNHMTDVLTDIRKYRFEFTPHAQLPEPTLSINQITGGNAANVVPDECTAKIDMRTVPGQSHEKIKSDFEEIFARHRQADSDFQIEMKNIGEMHPLMTDPQCEFVQTALELSGNTAPKPISFCTDAPCYASFHAPVIICGPGDPEMCHKPDEYVELSQLEPARILYRNLIQHYLL